jgi:hypothetical protein
VSWEQYADILRLSREEARENAQAVPSACPNDGEPLQMGPDGFLFCISDGWRPSGAPLL